MRSRPAVSENSVGFTSKKLSGVVMKAKGGFVRSMQNANLHKFPELYIAV